MLTEKKKDDWKTVVFPAYSVFFQSHHFLTYSSVIKVAEKSAFFSHMLWDD